MIATKYVAPRKSLLTLLAAVVVFAVVVATISSTLQIFENLRKYLITVGNEDDIILELVFVLKWDYHVGASTTGYKGYNQVANTLL